MIMSTDRPVFVSYSANREDVILNRVFGKRQTGFYIDVGAAHPVHENDTKALYDRGWCGINIEPAPNVFRELAEQRPRDRNMNVAVSDVPGRIVLHQVVGTALSTCDADAAKQAAARGLEVVPHVTEAVTLRGALEAVATPPIDLLKVDVEGLELQVLSSNDWTRFRPKLILVATGTSQTPIRRDDGVAPYLAAQDYRHVYFDGANNYYVDRDFQTAPGMFDRPPNVFDHFEPYSQHEIARHRDTLIGQVRSLAEERDRALALVGTAQAQARLGMRQAETLSIDVENARAELLSMRERGTALAAQMEAMGQEHERLKAAHERLETVERERAATAVRLASELDRVYASASWWITRPLRGLARPGRSLRIILGRFQR